MSARPTVSVTTESSSDTACSATLQAIAALGTHSRAAVASLLSTGDWPVAELEVLLARLVQEHRVDMAKYSEALPLWAVHAMYITMYQTGGPVDCAACPKLARHDSKVHGKRLQVANLVLYVLGLALQFALAHGRAPSIADMCGGSGHVSAVLLALLPGARVQLVDAGTSGPDIAAARAGALHAEVRDEANAARGGHGVVDDGSSPPPQVGALTMCRKELQAWDGWFDIGVALHACGEATDIAMDLAQRSSAAMVSVPCCLGRLKYAPQTRVLPQSTAFRRTCTREQWLELASSGDVHNHGRVQRVLRRVQREWDANPDKLPPIWQHSLCRLRSWDSSALIPIAITDHDMDTASAPFQRSVIHRRAAKLVFELDRIAAWREAGRACRITHMCPIEATAKNDVIVSSPAEWREGPAIPSNDQLYTALMVLCRAGVPSAFEPPVPNTRRRGEPVPWCSDVWRRLRRNAGTSGHSLMDLLRVAWASVLPSEPRRRRRSSANPLSPASARLAAAAAVASGGGS